MGSGPCSTDRQAGFEQLTANPLRIGLSMDAEVDISRKGGKMLADAPRATALAQTAVYSQLDRGADAEVERIVATNIGGKGGATAAKTAAANVIFELDQKPGQSRGVQQLSIR